MEGRWVVAKVIIKILFEVAKCESGIEVRFKYVPPIWLPLWGPMSQS